MSYRVPIHDTDELGSMMWCCLPDIPVAMHLNRFLSESPMPTHNWLSSEPPMFEGMQHTFSQMKKFSILQGSVVTFSGVVSKGFVLFWDNINNLKYE